MGRPATLVAAGTARERGAATKGIVGLGVLVGAVEELVQDAEEAVEAVVTALEAAGLSLGAVVNAVGLEAAVALMMAAVRVGVPWAAGAVAALVGAVVVGHHLPLWPGPPLWDRLPHIHDSSLHVQHVADWMLIKART